MEKMKVRYVATLFLLLLVPSRGLAFPDAIEKGPTGHSHVETYRYGAVAAGKETDKEEIELTLAFEEDSSAYVSTIVSVKSDERITIEMTEEGNLISGTRSLRRGPGGPSEERIWRDGKTAYVEQTSGSDREIKHLDIPEGKTLALEGSLMTLLRFFPYDSTTRWELFMIDFSGRSVTATARQAGIERITVPAGEFSCYRMEVLVHTFILSPTIVCWVTTEKPHFVVRSEGKRGIFTPKYITTLIGRQ
ncbi:MAG: hypothetical protein ABSD38_27925 [Syntrophorhabdales bacterium]|jgi:hypothetical protein